MHRLSEVLNVLVNGDLLARDFAHIADGAGAPRELVVGVEFRYHGVRGVAQTLELNIRVANLVPTANSSFSTTLVFVICKEGDHSIRIFQNYRIWTQKTPHILHFKARVSPPFASSTFRHKGSGAQGI